MKRKQIIIGVAITAILTPFLLIQIPLADIPAILGKVNPIYGIGGFVSYVFTYLFRTLRFRLLLNQRISIKDLFSIVCVHNMANNILPARTGELSYIYFVRKIHGIPLGEGIATLAVARIFDLIVICGIFLISTLLVGELPTLISNAFSVIAILLILLVFLLVLLVYRGQRVMRKIEGIASKLNLKDSRPVGFLLQKGNETISAFDVIQSKKTILLCFLLSVLVWASAYLTGYILVSQMAINISVWKVLIGLTFMVFITILPIWGIGGFGTMEGTWTVVFMALGVSKGLAITSGFGYHILTLIYCLVTGCYGLIAMRLRRSQKVSSS